jgi:hypothetical protein
MRKYKPWNLSNRYGVSHYEVPDDFVRDDYLKRYGTVDVVQVNTDGTRTSYPMNHRVLAECLGRDQFESVGCWKELR